MNRQPSTPHPLARPRGAHRTDADTLEWEELPSLAHVLQRYREHGTAARGATLAWNSTCPQPLDDGRGHGSALAAPFDEVIGGLHTRELVGPELFEHFFGTPAAR